MRTKPLIVRLKEIWERNKEEPDFSKFLNKKEEEGDNNNNNKEKDDA